MAGQLSDREQIAALIKASAATKAKLAADEGVLGLVLRAIDLLESRFRAGSKVLIFGNGGSAADAMHIAAEFLGRFTLDRDPLPAISLSDNVSAITAIGNDLGYEDTFARQLRALVKPGDVAIGLSTSGGSRNVVDGLTAARQAGAHTIVFTGASESPCGLAAEICLRMPSSETARIQESYMLLSHAICAVVEQRLFMDDA